jgi:hypothetical protein
MEQPETSSAPSKPLTEPATAFDNRSTTPERAMEIRALEPGAPASDCIEDADAIERLDESAFPFVWE